MTIRNLTIAEYFHLAMPLARDNWQETGFGFPFAPSYAHYAAMEAAGLLVFVGAFDGDNLVGYCTAIVTGHPYNPDVIMANSDALFVAHDHRGGALPGRLIRFVEREAKARGATRMLWHARAGTPLASVMERRGYRPVDMIVMKEFDHGD